jgi:predicted nucleic acid-binding Zn ribbon protein
METLKSLIAKKKRQHGLKRPLEIYELFGEWNRHAGEIFGHKKIRCHPKFLKGKTLYIQVEGAPLASELQLRQYQLMQKINRHFGRKMVERIVFKL